jgi:prevent-host-death family protein
VKKTGKVTKRDARVSELKASLSQYLARVKSGEEVVITERGKPVAKLVPIEPAPSGEVERLRELERRGLVTIGTGQVPQRLWDLPMPDDPGNAVREALVEEREEGR